MCPNNLYRRLESVSRTIQTYQNTVKHNINSGGAITSTGWMSQLEPHCWAAMLHTSIQTIT